MELSLKRFRTNDQATIGELFIDSKFQCYTLEDVVREIRGVPVESWKINGKTAIPTGEYEVIISESNRFKRPLPEILNVPGFTGIRIHPGNIAVDTEGCILVGRGHSDYSLSESRKAFNVLYDIINEAFENDEKITIKIC